MTNSCGSSAVTTLERSAQVVHDDAGSPRGKEFCVTFSEPSSTACDHDDLAVISDFRHGSMGIVETGVGRNRCGEKPV
jgi:hypothetical protein